MSAGEIGQDCAERRADDFRHGQLCSRGANEAVESLQKIVAALGFQTCHTARDTVAALELVHMNRKEQLRTFAYCSNLDQFDSLDAIVKDTG